MGEPKNPHFYDSGFFGRVPELQNQHYLSLETPGYLNESRKFPGTLETIIFFININMLGNTRF